MLVVHGTWLVSDLKELLAARTAISRRGQHLTFRGRVLQDYDTLTECGIRRGGTIELGCRPVLGV